MAERILIAMYRNRKNIPMKYITKKINSTYSILRKSLEELELMNLVTIRKINNKSMLISLTKTGEYTSEYLYKINKIIEEDIDQRCEKFKYVLSI